MTLTRKDAAGTAFSALAVLVYLTTHEGWNVWLIGDHHRWAAAVILLLGLAACAAGGAQDAMERKLPVTLGSLAMVLGIVAIATGSLTPLSLLVVDIVVLWVITTYRHGTARMPRGAVHA